MNKTLKVMTSAALLAGVVAPVAVTTVSADSKNVITTVPQIADDYEAKPQTDGGTDYGTPVSSILVKEDNVAFTDGQIFRVTLPEGVEFVEDAYAAATNTDLAGKIGKVTVQNVTKSTLELSINTLNAFLDNDGAGNDVAKDTLTIPMYVKVDGATGELKATIESMDTTVSPGTYTFAKVAAGDTTTTIDSVKTVGEDSSAIGVIRVDENSIGAVGADAQKVVFKLPSKFNWDAATIEFTAGFSTVEGNAIITDTDNDGNILEHVADGADAGTTAGQISDIPENSYIKEIDGNTLTVYFNPANTRTQRGTIYVKSATISADDDASFGDVEVSVSGDKVTDQDVKIATYADYGISVEATGDAKEIVAGLLDDRDDLKAVKVNIKESVAQSIVTGRKTTVKFPSWVKVVDMKFSDDSEVTFQQYNGQDYTTNTDQNEVTFQVNNLGSKADFDVEFYLTVQAEKTGDITAEFESRSGIEGEVVVAKAVAPVTVEAKAADVQVGVRNQALGEIVITESTKASIKEGTLTVTLPDGYEFTKKPVVEVVEGNIDIDEEDVEVQQVNNTGSKRQLVIPVDSESTKASKIKISGGEMTLDRTAPVGPIKADIGGSLVQNADQNDVANKFEDKFKAAEFVIANVVTPAPGQTVAKEVSFKIGATTYTVAGEEKTMDVAPFVEAGRTYMPIRYVAEAVGVDTDSIFWDQATQTATLMKGDRVVQLTKGSKSLKVNGATIAMDAAAQIKDGRTVLPVRFVGQALGATVDYDATAQTVTVK